jgi:hypothetical protein
MELNAQAGRRLACSAREAKRVAATARRKARGRGRPGEATRGSQVEELAGRCERVAEQIAMRVRGEKISDRLVSLADPGARPIRNGKLGKPNEFGYVAQICEVTDNTGPGSPRPGAAGRHRPRQPGREHPAPRHRGGTRAASGPEGQSPWTVAGNSGASVGSRRHAPRHRKVSPLPDACLCLQQPLILWTSAGWAA